MNNTPISVLIVDDHTVVRTGIAALIDIEPDLELAGEARDGVEALEKARLLNPDVIVMDLVMPHMDGITAIREIIQENPEAKILVLTSYVEEEKVIPAIRSGALGYLIKDSSSEELIRAIHEVYRGNPSLPPALTRILIHGNIHQTDENENPEQVRLTERETDVLKMIAQGMTDKDIAEALTISHTTVRYHVTNVLTKLQLENRTQAALYAIRSGLITP